MLLNLPEDYLHRLPDLEQYLSRLKPTIKPEVSGAAIKPLVFIAGPYSHPYPIYNTHRAMVWYDALVESQIVIPYCAHWTMFQDLILPRPYEEWLSVDRQILRRCDGVLRLIGTSEGADGEVSLAEKLQKKIFREERFEDLFPWAVEWIEANN